MSVRSAPWTTVALVVLCGGLAVTVVLEISGGLSLAPEVTAAAPVSPEIDWTPDAVDFEPPSPDSLDEITARPLFSPSRKPFVLPSDDAPAPVADQPLPEVQLIGVLLTEEQRAALMQAEGAVEPGWVREGAEIEGWRVERIEQHRVHLRADDRLETVELRSDTAVPAKSRPKPRRTRSDQRREVANERADEPEAPDQGEADLEEKQNDEEDTDG